MLASRDSAQSLDSCFLSSPSDPVQRSTANQQHDLKISAAHILIKQWLHLLEKI